MNEVKAKEVLTNLIDSLKLTKTERDMLYEAMSVLEKAKKEKLRL